MTPAEHERFEAKYVGEPNSGCWLWDASAQADGYGRMRIGDETRLAHRLSYEHHRGPIPHGLLVLHRCDVPACVNPDHLFLGTNAENMVDMVRKGRSKSEGRCRGERGPAAKLTDEKVRRIRDLGSAGMPQRKIAAQVGVSQRSILRVLQHQTWRHVR